MSRSDWKILKENREKKQLELLKNCLTEIKDANISLVENDPPDGSFTLDGKKVSIELTELYWDEDNEGLNKKAQESLSGQIISIAQKKYENLNLQPVHVGVSFKDNYGRQRPYRSNDSLRSSDKEKLSDHIVQMVIKYFPASDSGNVQIDEFDNNCERILDAKLNDISITRYPQATGNCWFTGNGGLIPEITFEIIADCISKKNKRLKFYKHLYEINWLVIIERWNNMSGWFEFEFADKILNSNYEFDFDRIFILRCWEGTVIELKKLNRKQNVQECDATNAYSSTPAG